MKISEIRAEAERRVEMLDLVSTQTYNRAVIALAEIAEAVVEFRGWGAMTGSDRDLHNAKFDAALAKLEAL